MGRNERRYIKAGEREREKCGSKQGKFFQNNNNLLFVFSSFFALFFPPQLRFALLLPAFLSPIHTLALLLFLSLSSLPLPLPLPLALSLSRYVMDNVQGASQDALNYAFSQYCGIFMASSFYFILYCCMQSCARRKENVICSYIDIDR